MVAGFGQEAAQEVAIESIGRIRFEPGRLADTAAGDSDWRSDCDRRHGPQAQRAHREDRARN